MKVKDALSHAGDNPDIVIPRDPPLDDQLFAAVSLQELPTDFAAAPVVSAAGQAAGAVGGTDQVQSARFAGPLSASWSSQTSSGFEARSLNAGSATVRDSQGNVVGSGTVAF